MTAERFDSERFEELRVQRALGQLSAAECAELSALLAARAGVDLEADEFAVAAIELARLAPEPLPAGLRQKLETDARAHVAHRAAPHAAAVPPAPGPKLRVVEPPPRRGSWGWIAAAAAIVVAAFGWWQRFAPPPPASPADERIRLVAQEGVLDVPWSGTDFAKGAEGDVVWDPSAQRGFMRIKGLAKNDPTREQYQLWIFDAAQEHPVDGGVFDISSEGEVVIPIDAKLRVASPTLFAVTVEKPGGVVVSARAKIVLAGKI
jgi:anti-sigma-K factor RskA